MDTVILSRIQFGLFIAFHYLFVPLSMGLSMMLVLMEGLYLVTKKNIYKQMTWFWIGVFAITFVVGVVTGIMQIFPLDLIGRGFPNIQGTCLEHF